VGKWGGKEEWGELPLSLTHTGIHTLNPLFLPPHNIHTLLQRESRANIVANTDITMCTLPTRFHNSPKITFYALL